MCVAIFRPSGSILTKKLLKKAHSNNPDSWGFAYPHDNQNEMVVKHGLSGFRQFWRAYRNIPANRPALIHFRIGTSGGFDEANCHPFLIDKKHALIHNGNLEYRLKEKNLEKVSDTAVFVKNYLEPAFTDPNLKDKDFWKSEAFRWLLEESIGDTNKIVILDAEGEGVIFNEVSGEWEDNGAWFSNTSYKTDRKSIRGAKVEIFEENGQRKERTTYQSKRQITRYLPPLSKTVETTQEKKPFERELLPVESQIDLLELY